MAVGKRKAFDNAKVGDQIILVAFSKFEITPKSKVIDATVVKSGEQFMSVEFTDNKGDVQTLQFQQGKWCEASNRPKFTAFPDRQVLSDHFEIAKLRARIGVAFNFTCNGYQEFTVDQLRNAAKALGLDDV